MKNFPSMGQNVYISYLSFPTSIEKVNVYSWSFCFLDAQLEDRAFLKINMGMSEQPEEVASLYSNFIRNM